MSIKLRLEGFEELLKDIEAAGGKIDEACESAIKQSAQTMQDELKTQMRAVNADEGLINAMPQWQLEKEGNKVMARVGYRKGNYDPNNISDGYKAVFLNYGTPYRTKHGKEKARGFIEVAKKKANPKIKKQQKQALEKILERLNKK